MALRGDCDSYLSNVFLIVACPTKSDMRIAILGLSSCFKKIFSLARFMLRYQQMRDQPGESPMTALTDYAAAAVKSEVLAKSCRLSAAPSTRSSSFHFSARAKF